MSISYKWDAYYENAHTHTHTHPHIQNEEEEEKNETILSQFLSLSKRNAYKVKHCRCSKRQTSHKFHLTTKHSYTHLRNFYQARLSFFLPFFCVVVSRQINIFTVRNHLECVCVCLYICFRI